MTISKCAIPLAFCFLPGWLLLNLGTSAAPVPDQSESLEQAQERIQGAVNSARELWRIKQQPDKAREVLATARGNDTNAPALLMELAVLEVAQTNHSAADTAARTALDLAKTPHDGFNARVVLAYVVWDEVLMGILHSGAAITNAGCIAQVQQTVQLVDPIMQSDPGCRYPSQFQVFLALFAENGPAALRAWQSYYRIAPGDTAPQGLAEPSQTLNRLLPTLSGTAEDSARREIIEALAASRLFAEAAAMALQWNLKPDDTLRDIITYGQWTDKLAANLGEEYRQRTLGRNYPEYKANVESIMRTQAAELWKQLHWRTSPKRFTMPRFTREMENRFGAVFRLNYPDALSYAHHVGERSVTVEQYGRKQVMRFIELDSVVSNGYFDWISGAQGSGFGGWAVPPDSFFEVRMDRGVNAWPQATDPDLVSLDREKLGRLEREDAEKAKANPTSYFPGLVLRLRMNSHEKLLRSLKDRGLHGQELRNAFIKQYDEAVRASVIVAHEGRHVLDMSNRLRIWKPEDLEFRAKLSEVAFSPNPPITLGCGTIFSPGIDSGSHAHDRAGRRIMKGLFAWMQRHAAEIPSLDRSLPLLPQFDRLTDEQMRAAFRSMDPQANTH